MAAPPDPFAEIRPLSVRTVRGASYWASFPVTRLDVAVGAYDEISTADVPGVGEALLAALPGLWEHRCSVGERGGFAVRMRRGTYAPHVMEHVALALQEEAGHDVGYGRARGGDRPGEYTVAVEHRHAAVGRRAVEAAADLVRAAFAGRRVDAAPVVAALRALADTPDLPRPAGHVRCGVTGGAGRSAFLRELARRLGSDDGLVDVPPASLLVEGLSYGRSGTGAVLDASPRGVAERYRDPERAARLVSTVADAVPKGGLVVCRASAWRVQEEVRDAGRGVAVFTAAPRVDRRDARYARATAVVRDGRVVVEGDAGETDAGAVHADAPPAVQAAAALAAYALGVPAMREDDAAAD